MDNRDGDLNGSCGGRMYRVLRRGDRAYLYSGHTGQIYSLNVEGMEALTSGSLDDERLRNLEASCTKATAVVPPPCQLTRMREELKVALDRKIRQVVLGVTEDCNLRCRYCINSGNYPGVHSYSPQRMPWEVARKAIDYLLANSQESPRPPAIAFYGGEPFLAFSLIRRCVEYAESISRPGRKVKFTTTTNGTLLNKEIRAFIAEHDFSLLVSMDGPPEIHDRYRRDRAGRPTFQRITRNLDSLRKEAPDYFATRVVFVTVLAPPVHQSTLMDFFDGCGTTCFVTSMESYANSDLPPLFEASTGAEQLERSFEEASRRWIPGEEIKQLSRFAVASLGPVLRRIQSRNQRPDAAYHCLGQCLPGVRRFFVNFRGEIYPCEKAEGARDVCIGHVDSGINPDLSWKLLTRFMDMVAHRCNGCWMRSLCWSCLAEAVHGGRFDPQKMEFKCKTRQASTLNLLGLYSSLVGSDPHSLDFLFKIFLWE